MTKPTVLIAGHLPDNTVAELKSLFDTVEYPDDASQAAQLFATHGAQIQGIALRKVIIDQQVLAALPHLEIISSYSAGLDNVDVDAVKAKGIQICNTSHILAEDVANAALGLALSVTRHLVEADHFVRSKQWSKTNQFKLGCSISSMKVGIAGMGTIGLEVAKRFKACGADISYYGPHRKPVDYTYFDDIQALAKHVDMLVLTCPLNEDTHHLVNADVLNALGKEGFLVNIARGPIVDESALIVALANNEIAGAALDVFEHEPNVPDALLKDHRVVLAPHLGSGTVETRTKMADNIVKTLAAYFANKN